MNEALATANPYPHSRAFVLKLHRDAGPDLKRGLLRGRIEHVASGMRGEFGGTQELLDWLAQALAQECEDTLPPRPRAPGGGAF